VGVVTEFEPFFTGNRGSTQISGPLAGFQVGFNWQNGPVLIGAEAQFSWARLKGDHENNLHDMIDEFLGFELASGTDRFFTRVDSLGTIAARLGLVTGPQDRTLVYVKGGAAWVRDKYTLEHLGNAIDCLTFIVTLCESTNVNSTLSGRQTRWGWMAGIGLEFGIWDNVSAKVEYNYLGFGKKSVRLRGTANVVETEGFDVDEFTVDVVRDFDVRQDIQLIKFGVNYRFGGLFGAPAPIAARY
jgi:outer membrane immunogenic protein